MLYNSELNSFKRFISEWDIDSEYVLFGASKECVQFIRTMDYLFGSEKLKIKCIVDHEVKTGIANNLNKVSSYYHQSKDFSNTRTNIQLVNINDFDKQGNVIVTTDEFRKDYQMYLDEHKIKHTWYKNIASIWPYEYLNKIHIFQSDVLVTERCNLNCSHCNMFIPHFEMPKHRELDTMIKDIDSYFNIVDYVSVFHLVGGEPFLHPQIQDVIQHILSNHIHKIDKFIITTNGSIAPKPSTIELLKSSNVILSVSNYSDKLEKLKTKVEKVIDIYKTNGIKHYVRNEIEWYDFGDLRVKNNLPTDKLIKHFDSCTAPFRGLNDGKFYYCHLNTGAVLTKLFPLDKNDYVEIDKVSKEDLLKFDLGYTDLGYITFCDNCNGCNTGIKIPVSYEKQGVRDL
jgi:organic radical activating enzyme